MSTVRSLGRAVKPGVLTLGQRQRVAVHLTGLPQAPLRPRRHPPPGRLPRPRVPGVHRVLVRAVQEALRLARRVGDHRTSENRDHRLHRPLPPPTPLRARLPHPRRGRRHLATHARPTQPKRPEPTTTTGSTSRGVTPVNSSYSKSVCVTQKTGPDLGSRVLSRYDVAVVRGFDFPPAPPCDVPRHRKRPNLIWVRVVVVFGVVAGWSAEGLVVAGGVEGEVAEELAGGGVDDADVEVVR